MSEPLDILIYEVSYRRVAERLRDIARALRLSIMDKQGAIRVNGSSVPVENVCATVGWPNSDIFAAECRGEVAGSLHRSRLCRSKWLRVAESTSLKRSPACRGRRLRPGRDKVRARPDGSAVARLGSRWSSGATPPPAVELGLEEREVRLDVPHTLCIPGELECLLPLRIRTH